MIKRRCKRSELILPVFPDLDGLDRCERVKIMADWFRVFYNKYVLFNDKLDRKYDFFISPMIDEAFFTRENMQKLFAYADVYRAYKIKMYDLGIKTVINKESDKEFINHHINHFKKDMRRWLKEKGIIRLRGNNVAQLIDAVDEIDFTV